MNKKQFVVWGLGRFGTSVAVTLQSMGHEVLGIDSNEDVVQELSSVLTHVVMTENVDETTVKTLGLHNFDMAIVAIGDLEANLLCTMLLKEAGIHKIVVKAGSALHGKMLEKLGADQIIYPERDMGHRVAHNLAFHNIMDFIELSESFSLVELAVPQKFIGKNLIDLDLRRQHGVNLVGLKRNGEVIINVNPQENFEAKDLLIVVGDNASVQRLEEGK